MKILTAIFCIILGLDPTRGAQASQGTNAASSVQPSIEMRTYKVDSLVFHENLKRVQSTKGTKLNDSELTQSVLEEKGH